MKTSTFALVSRASLFAAALSALVALPACSGDADSHEGERRVVGSEESALLDKETISIGADNLTLSTFLINPLRNGTTVEASGNHVVIRPSASLAALLQTPTIAFDLPPYVVTADGATAQVQSVDGALDMSAFGLAIVGADLVLTFKGHATIAFAVTESVLGIDVTVHPTLHVPELDVTVKIAWNAAQQRFFVEPGGVGVDMPGESVSDCGAFGWCNGIINGHIDQVKAGMASAVASGLGGIIAAPSVSSAFESLSEVACQALVPSTPLATTPWSLDGLQISAGKITCNLSRTVAPAPFGPCTVGSAGVCSGSVVASCMNVSAAETYTLQHLAGGSWSNVAASYLKGSVANEGDLVANGQTATGTGAESYRVCSSNAAGTVCSPTLSVDLHTTLKCCAQPVNGCPALLPHWNASTCKCDKGVVQLSSEGGTERRGPGRSSGAASAYARKDEHSTDVGAGDDPRRTISTDSTRTPGLAVTDRP